MRWVAHIYVFFGLCLCTCLSANPAAWQGLYGSDGGKAAEDSTAIAMARGWKLKAEKLCIAGSYDSSAYYYARASALFEESSHWYLNIISGNGYHLSRFLHRKDAEHAFEGLQKNLHLATEKLGRESDAVAYTYHVKGIISAAISAYDDAIEAYTLAIELLTSRYGRHHLKLASVYNDFGLLYKSQGEYELALDYFHQAIYIYLNVPNDKQVLLANAYGNAGLAEKGRNNYGEAREYYHKALEIFKVQLGERHEKVIHSYHNLGNLYITDKDYDQAIPYLEKTRELLMEKYGAQSTKLIKIYSSLGNLYNLGLKDYDKAFRNYRRAADIVRDKQPRNRERLGYIYRKTGHIFGKQEKYDKALEYYQQSIIALAPGFDDPDITVNPEPERMIRLRSAQLTLKAKALCFEKIYQDRTNDLKDLELSFATRKISIELIDMILMNYQQESSKLDYINKKKRNYEKIIGIALELFKRTGKPIYHELAFGFAEKSKANVLLSIIQESEARNFSGIPESLLETGKQLAEQRARFENEMALAIAGKENKDSLLASHIQDSLFRIKRSYEQWMEHIETRHPEYYELKHNKKTVGIEALRSLLPDRQTVMVNYFKGVDSLYIFLLSQHDFRVVAFPSPDSLDHHIKQLVRSIKRHSSKGYRQSAQVLYNHLIEPATSFLDPYEKWIILPDGLLNHVPFEALIRHKPHPQSKDFNKLDYLILHHDISYHYSATLWYKSHQSVRPAPPFQNFIAFAPGFETGSGDPPVLLTARGNRDELTPLPHTATEVSSIGRVMKEHGIEHHIVIGEEATKQQFKSLAGQYKYVHLATHGWADREMPKLSKLAFAAPGKQAPAADFLYANETYNLSLKADLVVLSSCKSGLGKLISGEGMLSLSRGFLYAGANNILYSLWEVNDRFTADMMVIFYRHVMNGNSYAKALRKAKLEMIRDPQTAFPHKWSGFILLGK